MIKIFIYFFFILIRTLKNKKKCLIYKLEAYTLICELIYVLFNK